MCGFCRTARKPRAVDCSWELLRRLVPKSCSYPTSYPTLCSLRCVPEADQPHRGQSTKTGGCQLPPSLDTCANSGTYAFLKSAKVLHPIGRGIRGFRFPDISTNLIYFGVCTSS